MKIYKTIVAISGDPEYHGQILRMDTIQYEGQMWLVAMWLDSPSEGFSVPERIICLDTLPHHISSFENADFVLNDPIPKSVLDGRVPEKSEFEYVVKERPNLKVPRIH